MNHRLNYKSNVNSINQFKLAKMSQAAAIPTDPTNPTNPSDNKYNPDVMKKFNEANKKPNSSKPEFVNSYYKTITNQPIKKTINSTNELKLEMDKPDLVKISSSYETSLKERMEEGASVKKSIDQYKKKNGIDDSSALNQWNPPTRFTSNKSNNNVDSIPLIDPSAEKETHLNLKSGFMTYSLKENDKLKEEKMRFNKILEDLDFLAN